MKPISVKPMKPISVSSIVRELLDPNGAHGQGGAFLRSFLDMVGLGPHVAIDPNARRPTCEEPTRYATSPLRRIDILLRPDNRFAIGIENKPLWAPDQPDRVRDYSDHLAKCGGGYLLVLLTADAGRSPEGPRQRGGGQT
jgi:hypothetical protein